MDSKTRTFTNITDKDFTHSWDKVEYTFKAGQTIMLEAFKAFHFAKHLTMSILNDPRGKNGAYTKNDITTVMNKILGTEKEVAPVQAAEAEAELLNQVTELDGMKKAELVEFAEEKGIEIDKTAKKDDIRAAIEAEFDSE